MKAEKLTWVLLLALLLQSSFTQISLASETINTEENADVLNSAKAENLRTQNSKEDTKDSNTANAVKKIKDGF